MVRDSVAADAAAIRDIYRHYVLSSSVTFEEQPPGLEELLTRRARVLELGLPHLVAEREGRVIGYAYASAYRLRPAYRYTVEDSIYIAHDCRGAGVGSALLRALLAGCEAAGRRQMIGIVGDSSNTASIALHRRFGFRPIGTLTAVGFKFGRWVDTVLMQRELGSGAKDLPALAKA